MNISASLSKFRKNEARIYNEEWILKIHIESFTTWNDKTEPLWKLVIHLLAFETDHTKNCMFNLFHHYLSDKEPSLERSNFVFSFQVEWNWKTISSTALYLNWKLVRDILLATKVTMVDGCPAGRQVCFNASGEKYLTQTFRPGIPDYRLACRCTYAFLRYNSSYMTSILAYGNDTVDQCLFFS